MTSDFFNDLDGDSLSAAMAVAILQDDPATAAITVRDLYDHPTAAELAAFAETVGGRERWYSTAGAATSGQRPIAATLFQSAWLLMDFVVASLVSYVLLFEATPAVVERIGVVASTLLSATRAHWPGGVHRRNRCVCSLAQATPHRPLPADSCAGVGPTVVETLDPAPRCVAHPMVADRGHRVPEDGAARPRRAHRRTRAHPPRRRTNRTAVGIFSTSATT